MIDGILLVDKPCGPTSADVVRALKRRHGFSTIGHLGTLDPMATGLLPLCVGAGSKIAQFLASGGKAYSGTIRLGVATDTLDVTGRTVEERAVPTFDDAALEAAARGFIGEQRQQPPLYSAVKVGGRPLHELARAGVTVEREARPITIEELVVRREGEALIWFEVRCSKGTYVRVIADELGRALGTVAALASLRRTEFGPFDIAEAHRLETLLETPPQELPVVPSRAALGRVLPEIDVEPRLAWAIAAGQRAALRELARPGPQAGFASVIAPNGALLAVLEATSGEWQIRRVLMPEAAELYRVRTSC